MNTIDTKKTILILLLGLAWSFWQCNRPLDSEPVAIDTNEHPYNDPPDDEEDALARINTSTTAGHELKKLLQERQNKSTKNPTYSTNPQLVANKLCLAIQAGEATLVAHLAKNAREFQIDLNQAGTKGLTPLHAAAQKGDLETLKALAEEGQADLLVKTKEKGADGKEVSIKRSVLQWAARAGHAAVIEYLASKVTADQSKKLLDYQDAAGYTALHYAAENGNVGAVKALLKAGAKQRIEGPVRVWGLPYICTPKILAEEEMNLHKPIMTLDEIEGYQEIIKLLSTLAISY